METLASPTAWTRQSLSKSSLRRELRPDLRQAIAVRKHKVKYGPIPEEEPTSPSLISNLRVPVLSVPKPGLVSNPICNPSKSDAVGIQVVVTEVELNIDSSETIKTPNIPLEPEPESDHVIVLEELIKTLKKHDVHGPQLFRVEKEFCEILGSGGEGTVRGTSEPMDNKINHLRGSGKKWRASKFAIKSHSIRAEEEGGEDEETLLSYLGAADAEIKALSPALFRNHPNIVQLRGWGLCLDTLERSVGAGDYGKPTFLSPIQLPLLILERATGDLECFLQDVFCEDSEDEDDDNTLHQELDIEAGRSLLRSSPRKRSAGSSSDTAREDETVASSRSRRPIEFLSGSTIVGDESQPCLSPQPLRRRYTAPEQPQRKRRPRSFWLVAGMSRYEALRRLCIDVGRGLQALHDVDFTHGDLKPQNVLVFKDGPRLTAKLCDFGHSNSFGKDTTEAIYNGTPAWVPHWFDKKHKLGVEVLKDYDLTVYGALVWGSVFRQGFPPPIYTDQLNKSPEELFNLDIQNISQGGCCAIMGSKAKLVRRTRRLLQRTVFRTFAAAKSTDVQTKQPASRPWEELSGKTERASQFLLGDDVPTVATQAPNLLERDSMPNLQLGPGSRGSGNAVKYLENSEKRDHLLYGHEKFQDIEGCLDRLEYEMRERINQPPRDKAVAELYGLARFRAQISLQSRDEHMVAPPFNMVELSLTAKPCVELNTLAWMCKGEIGSHEVRTLHAGYDVWRSILDPDLLNKSERFERLLLLIQFGAGVNEICVDHPTEKHPRSILSCFLLSCRWQTIPTIARELCLRFEMLMRSTELSNTARYFLTAASHCRPANMSAADAVRFSALGEFELDKERYGEAYHVLEAKFEQLLDDVNDLDVDNTIQQQSGEATEATPLLPSPRKDKLRGWVKDGDAYIEGFTHSVTLEPPCIQPKHLRKVRIGQLGTRHVCDIDVTDFHLHDMTGEKLEAFNERVRQRFPVFDDAWFAMEHNYTMSDIDVLQELQWLQPSFEIYIPRLTPSAVVARAARNIFFVVRYPTAGLGLIWEFAVSVHHFFGAPLKVAYVSHMAHLRSLAETDWSLVRLANWFLRAVVHSVFLVLVFVLCVAAAAIVLALALSLI